jgi:hypothetical protein
MRQLTRMRLLRSDQPALVEQAQHRTTPAAASDVLIDGGVASLREISQLVD